MHTLISKREFWHKKLIELCFAYLQMLLVCCWRTNLLQLGPFIAIHDMNSNLWSAWILGNCGSYQQLLVNVNFFLPMKYARHGPQGALQTSIPSYILDMAEITIWRNYVTYLREINWGQIVKLLNLMTLYWKSCGLITFPSFVT